MVLPNWLSEQSPCASEFQLLNFSQCSIVNCRELLGGHSGQSNEDSSFFFSFLEKFLSVQFHSIEYIHIVNNHRHHPSPEVLLLVKLKLCTIEHELSSLPYPQPLATTILLLASVNLTTVGTHKCTHTVGLFVTFYFA